MSKRKNNTLGSNWEVRLVWQADTMSGLGTLVGTYGISVKLWGHGEVKHEDMFVTSPLAHKNPIPSALGEMHGS